MKRLAYILFVLCCCIPFHWTAASPTMAETDSLAKLLPSMPHDSTRLQTILKMTKIEQTTPECIRLSNQLYKEAIEQNNPKYAGNALYMQVIYYYNQNELDSVTQKLSAMEPFAEKANLWDYYFDGKRCLIELYSYREQIEFAINKAREMYRQAKERNNIRGQIGANQCLGTAYMGTNRWEEGEKALEEAHKLLPQMDNMVVSNSVLSQLISLCNIKKDYPKLKKYLSEQRTLLENYIKENPAMKEAFYDTFIFNDIYYTYYYVASKQASMAYEHLQNGNKYLNPHTYFMYKVLFHDAYASYYRLNKEYDKAISQLDSTIVMLKEAFSSDFVNQLGVKADILTEAGRSREALPIYQSIIHMKDSLVTDLSDKQLKQIQDNYQIDKIQLEEEKLQSKIQFIALAIVAIAVVILIFYTIRAFRVHKALKLAESETRKATQIAEEANESKNHFLSNMSYNIRIPLNGVVGFSQLIASEPNMDEQTRKEFSAIIQKNSEELMTLVNDVLDLSRLEAHMMKFQIQEYDVIAICKDAINMAHMRNENAIDIQFTTDIEEQNITTDTGRLMQTLLSTLTYPQKHNGTRVISFTVELDESKKFIHFHVVNSPSADPEFTSQEVNIHHEINRLLLAHFGGSYTVSTDAQGIPVIYLTYPVDTTSE